MDPPYKEAVKWLFSELLDECLRTGSFSVVQEFLPILDDLERKELLKYLFWQALTSGKWWLAEDCLADGFSLVPTEIYTDSPLHSAMYFCGDCPDVVVWLLAHGVELERRDLSHGNSTPLIYATGAGLNGVVELLLQRGADANASTIIDDDQTPLMIAAETGNEEAAKMLLAHGGEIARKGRWGQDAAGLARLRGYFELQHLLEGWQKG